MARIGDQGPYSKENVFIQTGQKNRSSGPNKKSTLPVGVTPRGNRFSAYITYEGSRHGLGTFESEEDATNAYQQAESAL